MTVGELREILNDPAIGDDTPVLIATADDRPWLVDLIGAYGAMAGPDPYLVLEMEPYTMTRPKPITQDTG